MEKIQKLCSFEGRCNKCWRCYLDLNIVIYLVWTSQVRTKRSNLLLLKWNICAEKNIKQSYSKEFTKIFFCNTLLIKRYCAELMLTPQSNIFWQKTESVWTLLRNSYTINIWPPVRSFNTFPINLSNWYCFIMLPTTYKSFLILKYAAFLYPQSSQVRSHL